MKIFSLTSFRCGIDRVSSIAAVSEGSELMHGTFLETFPRKGEQQFDLEKERERERGRIRERID